MVQQSRKRLSVLMHVFWIGGELKMSQPGHDSNTTRCVSRTVYGRFFGGDCAIRWDAVLARISNCILL